MVAVAVEAHLGLTMLLFLHEPAEAVAVAPMVLGELLAIPDLRAILVLLETPELVDRLDREQLLGTQVQQEGRVLLETLELVDRLVLEEL